MVKAQLNAAVKRLQQSRLMWIVAIMMIFIVVLVLLNRSPTIKTEAMTDADDVLGTELTKEVTDAVLVQQQSTVHALTESVEQLSKTLAQQQTQHEKALQDLKNIVELETQQLKTSLASKQKTREMAATPAAPQKPLVTIQRVTFSPKHTMKHTQAFVPSGTFVKAVVLGGADADASVNALKHNHSVMLFQSVSDGVLPNGDSAPLKGCFITASVVGDISSERAFATLQTLSCVKPNREVLDIPVQGWAFFNGKVGIKGVPLMRDNKVLTWAGLSGALAGVSQAAQAAQSVQSISALGLTRSVENNKIATYSALGGAGTAMDRLANYYIERAEQYHPVIQVGAGNVVTLVFKQGFELSARTPSMTDTSVEHKPATEQLAIPQELLNQIRQASQPSTSGVSA